MMTHSVGLGAKTVAVVEHASDCPPGTWASPVSTPYSSRVYYECNSGEPWMCEWFGIGCKGVIPVSAPAPKTPAEMTVPGAWTPETVSSEWHKRQQQSTAEQLQNTSAVAAVPSMAYRAGEAVTEALPDADSMINRTLVALVIIGSIAMVVIKLKR